MDTIDAIIDEAQQEHEIRSILLLDDDMDLAQTLRELLEMNNFVVTCARNGKEGLNEVIQMDFDVIICDLMMPHMPGDMFYLAVERLKPYLTPRFIFITAFGEEERVEKFMQQANGLVLFKPFSHDDLIRAISLVVRGHTRGSKGNQQRFSTVRL